MSAILSRLEIRAPEEAVIPTEKSAYRSRPFVWEATRIAVDSIWSHKLRSVLTLIGIIIGVASVVVVGGAIEGLGNYVTERLTSAFGSNTFMISRIARMHISGDEWEKLMKR